MNTEDEIRAVIADIKHTSIDEVDDLDVYSFMLAIENRGFILTRPVKW